MKMFDLKGTVLSLNTPSIVSLLNNIEYYKGKCGGVSKMKKVDVLKAMARRSNAVASNAIGNVYIGDDRERPLCDEGAQPKNLQEHMVVGYLNALDLISLTVSGSFTFLTHHGLDFLLGFLNHFLDSGRMNTSVNDKLFKCNTCNFTSYRIEA